MEKVLCIISDTVSLKDVCASIQEKKQSLDQRLTFIKKQVAAAEEQFREQVKPDWREMEKILLDMGKLPTDYFDREEFYSLTISLQRDVIELETKEDKDKDDSFQNLLKAMRHNFLGFIPPEDRK